MKSVASLSAAAALLSGTADAFWRMPCHSRTALARLDPVVEKGSISSHGHVIHGEAVNFDENTNYDQLRQSQCTSCAFSDDKSAYWTPSLHFVDASGQTEIVPQIGGMLAYYLLLGQNLQAFPKGFQMLAGDMRLRNFTGPVPDPPTSAWGPEDKTQEALMQKSIGFNCMNYGAQPEGSRQRHFMPDKAFIDANCANGIRAELFFPSCWNGKDITAPDHKSHMAYPSLIDGGECPEGYDTRLPSLFYETIWDTSRFNGKNGQFVWSNGDPTGYGYHGDFINGWDIDVLQSAVTQCTNPSGRVEDCPVFSSSLQSEATQGQCEIQSLPDAIKAENCAGPTQGLCGNVAVQDGPAPADPLTPGSPDTPAADPAAPKSSLAPESPSAPKSSSAPQYPSAPSASKSPSASQYPASPKSPAGSNSPIQDSPAGPSYPAGPKSPAGSNSPIQDSPAGPSYPAGSNSPLKDSPAGPGYPAGSESPAGSKSPAGSNSPLKDSPAGPGYPAGSESPAGSNSPLKDSPAGPGYPAGSESPAGSNSPLKDSPAGPGYPAGSKSPVAPQAPAGPVALALPTITPAPAPQVVKAAEQGETPSTTTYTSSGVVYEVVIETATATVTVTEDAPKKFRRHAAAHMRRKGFAGRR